MAVGCCFYFTKINGSNDIVDNYICPAVSSLETGHFQHPCKSRV